MPRLIMWNLITLDGYFEGAEKWERHHHHYVWGDELERFSIEQASNADVIMFGRVTYEGMAAHWQFAVGPVADIMNRIPKVVFSNTLETACWNNSHLVRGAAEVEVARMKRGPGRDILVFGSAELCNGLLRAGLFDEIRLCVAPVIPGAGMPLFEDGDEYRLQLLSVMPLSTGATIHRYRPSLEAH